MPPDQGKKRRDLEDLVKKARETRYRITDEFERHDRHKKRNLSEYIVYRSHISRIHALPSEGLRYKAVALGEPEVMPEDIVLFISAELERIKQESRQHKE